MKEGNRKTQGQESSEKAKKGRYCDTRLGGKEKKGGEDEEQEPLLIGGGVMAFLSSLDRGPRRKIYTL